MRLARLLPIFAVVLSLLGPVAAAAGEPTDQIKGAIDRTIGILKRPDLAREPRREERRALLRREIVPVFDFNEMSKRSLGVYWRDRTPEERKRFVDTFTKVLENTYLGKIESYKGEKIRYVAESMDPPYAEVKTLIITGKGQEIPVNYRMLKEPEGWRIYDVVIEGVSLVNNYRSQFASIMQRSSFQDLIKKLEATAARGSKGA